MEKVKRPTSRFGFGSMIHTIHMSDDVSKLNRFYEDVFGAIGFMSPDEPSFSPAERRYASLLLISDLCVETMAPQLPVDVTTPVGKFYDKFGSHWHSTGYTVAKYAELGAHLKEQGVFLGQPGGGEITDFSGPHSYFYPHPRQAGGVMVECCAGEMPNDPRNRVEFSSLRKLWRTHPLGADRLGWITVGVRDIDEHLALWQRLFEVEPIHAELNPLGHRSQYVHFGDSIVELAMPLDAGTALHDHVKAHGDMIYSVTLKVLDLDNAESHLKTKGVRTTRPEPETIVADIDDTLGAQWHFTTRHLPNDPYEGD